MQINVIKRDGHKEPLDLEKFHKVVSWACEGITNVSPSQIEINSHIQFYDNIKTSDIQETLIKASSELISEDTPNYQYVAGRLINYDLRKQVYGGYAVPDLLSHVKKNTDLQIYTKEILENYTEEEINLINSFVDHERDYLLTYVAMEQFRSKYLAKNRVTKEIFETPQMAYILISMVAFMRYSKEKRISYIKDFYDMISKFDISLPTPIMAGLRTPTKQFSSCVLIECDDTLDSINATASSVVRYISKKAGIGLGIGRIRAVNSPIRNGEINHTGLGPFIKYFQSAVKSCSQGGVRGGAATVHLPLWHLEIEDVIVMKNNKGTEENRARHLDYSIQFNKLMYERLISGGDITLFSPNDVPEVYDAFFDDPDKFKVLYEKAENDLKIRKKKIKAIELFSLFMEERKNTGRIYLMNVDHCNQHSSYITSVAPIKMSNLCQEITQPTIPLQDLNDSNGEIQLCTLAAHNMGSIKDDSHLEKICDLTVRAIDEILDYQEYPVLAAKNGTMNRRPIGVGLINLAYWLAKNDLKYDGIDKEGLQKLHEFAEKWSYYLIKSSINLAKEKGPCIKFKDTKYSLGIMPIDTYKKEVDELVDPIYHCDWESLRADAKTYGIRNSTLMALMPSETSSQISNSTNAVEPVRSLISIKQSKDGALKQVVPGFHKLKKKYDLLWNQKTPEGYLKICAVLQKFIDQSISVNTSYNPTFYPDNKVPMSTLLKDILMHYRYGGKTLYYSNTYDGAGEIIPDETDCSSCKI